jgi:cobalt-zinc-cadmium efflux system membrane fusion protein
MTAHTLSRAILLAALAAFAFGAPAGCDRPAGAGGDANGAADDHDPDDPVDHADHDGHDGHDGHDDEVRLTADALVRYGVTVGEASLWVLRSTFVAPARVGFDAEAMAHVGSSLSGRIVETRVRVGASVRKGDPLLVIESADLGEAQGEYLRARVAAEIAGPAAELARGAWERARELLDESQGISRTEVEGREGEYRAKEAELRQARAALDAAAHRLRLLGMTAEGVAALAGTGELDPRATIVAPIDGEVVQREVTLGEMVDPEQESLLVLANTESYWVLADIPEGRIPEVAAGSRAWVRTGAAEGATVESTIAFVSPFVDTATRTAQVRIEIPSAALALKPGMLVLVEIAAGDPALPDPAPVVAVPEGAVQTIDGAPVIFVPVPGEPDTFVPRRVATGKTVGGLIPILSGLVEGEPLVTAGSFILKAELGKSTAEHSH